jgi:hypothetical protein
MATREYEIATAILAKVPKDSRVDIAWQVVGRFARGLSLSSQVPSTIEPGKIVDEMTKTKKPVSMVAVVKDLTSLSIEARVAGKKISTPWSVDITSGKDVKKWRATLVALNSFNASLVTADELKVFDKAHPDPVVMAALKKDIDELDTQIKALNAQVKEKTTLRATKQKEYTDKGGK